MGVGNKGLEVLDEEETMDAGSDTALSYETNQTKVKTRCRLLWRGANAHWASAPCPRILPVTLVTLVFSHTTRATARTIQRQEKFRIKATHPKP